MKKIIPPAIVIVVVALLTWYQDASSALLSLALTGHIPGTSWTIPFWGMMAIYCLLITAILTYYIEDVLALQRTTKSPETHTSRMPRRRFGHI